MTLSWNEIKTRAQAFSYDWKDASNEDADAKPFLVAFFNVFGITHRKVATFEFRVKKLDSHDGYIDMLYKGNLLVEMKSKGKDLDKAYQQAHNYLHGLPQYELPGHILVSDFNRFRLHHLESGEVIEFTLQDLVKNVKHFGFLIGYQTKSYKEQDPVNIQAAELMGKLHDRLQEVGYTDHALEVYLVRLLFCLFADDTTIFNKDIFKDYIEQRSSQDGSDLAGRLAELYQVLNTPVEKRFKNIDESLNEFPYVNGKLFEEQLPMAAFDSKMRSNLLACCGLDWGKISPAIFGSMFQSVMNPVERRNLGAHYTSEKNILKVIKPLFLDELWKEFEAVKSSKPRLMQFHDRLGKLKFLDPACGCGNFLVVTYRELRLLEMEVLKVQLKNQQVISVNDLVLCNVDQFYGIEYEEFPAQIAQVALWLIDHQMNMLISNEFGQYFVRLPLSKSPTIIHADALELDWNAVVSRKNLSYILGNPPFIGHQWRSLSQVKGMDLVFKNVDRSGRLDYVAAWYLKASEYIQGTPIKVAFVSTNSITQGEQATILWPLLFGNYKIKIHFAHRTFSWSNEAKGNAGVHVVIIGFANFDINQKILFEYENIKGEPLAITVRNINAYLTEGKEIIIGSRSRPIHGFPEMTKGSQPTDGTKLILTPAEREYFLKNEPSSAKWIFPFIGGEELLHNTLRYCFWLKDCPPDEIKRMPLVLKRLDEVKEARLKSSTASVREFAKYPSLFTQDRQPSSNYLALPRVSSENRSYVPLSFLGPEIIAHEKLIIIPNATIYLFGVLMSVMHNAWTKHVSGRLESRISYSPAVYNNYPFPENPNEKQLKSIETAAQKVLDARAAFPGSSLADLYDPLTMPPVLVKAHQELDKAVDLAYRPQPFTSEANRMVFLFELYEKYTADLFSGGKGRKK